MSSADRITSATRALEGARSSLEARSDRDIVDALAAVFELWRDPKSACRRELEARLPSATGFSIETVRAGLELGFAPWTGEAFTRLVEHELGPESLHDSRSDRGHPLTAVVLAGSIPMPSVLSIVLPLVLRSAVLCKPASRDIVTANLVADSIRTIDPLLGDCVAVVSFDKDDAQASRAFFAAPCVVATGSSQTIEEVGSQLQREQARLLYGHRRSVGVIDLNSLGRESFVSKTEALAIDVALWDQLGCLSPTDFYLVGGIPEVVDAFAAAFAEALAKRERAWPRGFIAIEAAAAIARERSEAQMRAALGHRTRVHASPGTQWTVVVEQDSALRPAPLHRFVRLMPVRGVAELMKALAPISSVLAGIVMAGFEAQRDALTRELIQLGASRVCEAGELQAPPIDWPRDNLPVLRGMQMAGRPARSTPNA